MSTINLEMKQVNVCRFLAEALNEQLETFTEDSDVDPELIEGVVQIKLVDFDLLLEHLNDKFEEYSDSVDVINNFKKETKEDSEVFAYWEA